MEYFMIEIMAEELLEAMEDISIDFFVTKEKADDIYVACRTVLSGNIRLTLNSEKEYRRRKRGLTTSSTKKPMIRTHLSKEKYRW